MKFDEISVMNIVLSDAKEKARKQLTPHEFSQVKFTIEGKSIKVDAPPEVMAKLELYGKKAN